MWRADRPDFTASEVALACVSSIRRPGLRQRVQSRLAEFDSNSDRYQRSARLAQTHLIGAGDFAVTGIGESEHKWLYKNHMATPGGGGREFYSKLLMSAPGNLCVYCRYSVAKTLDHFVPKRHEAALSIEPWNLVPACMSCNHQMRDDFSDDPEHEMLHPYFMPDVSRWLYASVVEETPVTVTFIARPSNDTDSRLGNRIVNQYDALGLATLFEVVSANELSEVTRRLRLYFSDASSVEVSQHLRETSNSALAGDCNDRRGVMYEALAESDWFCSGGFLEE